MVFEYLKGMKNYQNQIKCEDGPIAEHIEEISISHPVLVSDFVLEIDTFLYSFCSFPVARH